MCDFTLSTTMFSHLLSHALFFFIFSAVHFISFFFFVSSSVLGFTSYPRLFSYARVRSFNVDPGGPRYLSAHHFHQGLHNRRPSQSYYLVSCVSARGVQGKRFPSVLYIHTLSFKYPQKILEIFASVSESLTSLAFDRFQSLLLSHPMSQVMVACLLAVVRTLLLE